MRSFCVYSHGKKISDRIYLKKIFSDEVGVFETLRAYDGRVFRKREHIDRLLESAQTIGFKPPLERAGLEREIKAAVNDFLRAHPNARARRLIVRITIFEDQVLLLIAMRPAQMQVAKKGVTLKTSPVKRSHCNAAAPETKTSAYQNAVLSELDPNPRNCLEGVMLDQNGYVAEVGVGNLFIIGSSDRLLTPSMPGILNGVTRRFVIECAVELGLSVRETRLTRHDIYNAHEAFLTNTSWEILPIRELDGRRIGKRIPGPVTLKLHQIFKKRVIDECRAKQNSMP